MKYVIIIGIALLAFYGWSSLQQSADRKKEERNAKLAMQEAQANVATMPEDERRKWFSLLDQAIDKKIKLLGNSIGLQTRTGYVCKQIK